MHKHKTKRGLTTSPLKSKQRKKVSLELLLLLQEMQQFSAPAAPHGAAQRGAHLAPAQGSVPQCSGQSGDCGTARPPARRSQPLTAPAAAAAHGAVPDREGRDNVPADLIEFLLLQPLLISFRTAHRMAILYRHRSGRGNSETPINALQPARCSKSRSALMEVAPSRPALTGRR